MRAIAPLRFSLGALPHRGPDPSLAGEEGSRFRRDLVSNMEGVDRFGQLLGVRTAPPGPPAGALSSGPPLSTCSGRSRSWKVESAVGTRVWAPHRERPAEVVEFFPIGCLGGGDRRFEGSGLGGACGLARRSAAVWPSSWLGEARQARDHRASVCSGPGQWWTGGPGRDRGALVLRVDDGWAGLSGDGWSFGSGRQAGALGSNSEGDRCAVLSAASLAERRVPRGTRGWDSSARRSTWNVPSRVGPNQRQKPHLSWEVHPTDSRWRGNDALEGIGHRSFGRTAIPPQPAPSGSSRR